jgi:hypothetical protein
VYPDLDTLRAALSGDLEGRRFLKFLSASAAPAHDPGLGPCIVWGGALDTQGYGAFRDATRRLRGAHRWLHERMHGPIPAGLDVHHVCHDRAVCAPERACECPHRACVVHTELRTRRDNILAGGSVMADRAARTRCQGKYAPPGGHDLTDPANVLLTPGGRPGLVLRHCLPCHRESDRRYQARRRARRRAQAAERAGQVTLLG